MTDTQAAVEASARLGGQLSHGEVSAFCTQLAMILKSGIAIDEGISIMLEDQSGTQGKNILSVIKSHVELHEPLYKALETTGVFPEYVVRMVEIGERSGRLDEVAESLSEYYEREENVSRSLKSAVAYPLVMITMMVLVIGVLVVKVLPVFNEVFLQLGSEMSGFSKGIMNAGGAIAGVSAAIAIIAVVVLVVMTLMRRTKGGREAIGKAGAHFFLTRKLNGKIASGRFASAMSLMLSSGLDTDHSLEMTERLIENPVIRKKLSRCRELVEGGGSFSDAITQTGIFSGVYARMVSVGFKTGSADTVMSKVAARYEDEVDTQLSNTISILEPTLVAILSIIVGMILLSVMLPLMGIMSSIG